MIAAARRRPLSILAQSAASPTDPLSLRCSSYFLRDGRNDRQSTAGSQRRRITPAQVVGFCVGLQPSQCTPLLLRSFATSRQRRAAAAKKDGADEKVPTHHHRSTANGQVRLPFLQQRVHKPHCTGQIRIFSEMRMQRS